MMGFPRDPGIRALVVEPGHFIVDADYAAIDLRVAAHLVDDERLRARLAPGRDIHAEAATELFGVRVDAVTVDQRQMGKILNLENLYCAGVDTVVESAAAKYGVHLRVDEAQALIDAFTRSYPRVAEALERARSTRYPAPTRTPLGRLHAFAPGASPGAQLAHVIQGTGADGLKLAICEMADELKKRESAFLLSVYDQTLIRAPYEAALAVKEIVVRHMKEAMRCFIPNVPIGVKAEVKNTWAG
jgi:DNA polymerase-1